MEDVPEFCLQLAYIAFGQSNELDLTYTYINMTFTVVMMAYGTCATNTASQHRSTLRALARVPAPPFDFPLTFP